MQAKKKYLLLYLKTGGGHLAPAKSIAKIIEHDPSANIEPVLIDGFEKTKKIIRFIIEDGYRNLQAKARWFYEALYAVNKVNLFAQINSSLISHFVKPYLREVFRAQQPEKIVIFHFFLIEPVYEVLRELKMNVKVITVVTDPYTAHPLWFLNKNQNFIVFSERLKYRCLRRGINEADITVFPFILNDKFSQKMPDEKIPELKREFGYDVNKKVILLLGGGDGIPKGMRILKILLKRFKNIEVAIVCGKNNSLLKKANRLKTANKYDNLKVYGYVDFIFELLNISDIVISKCGASTFLEILMMRKIPVIINYMWEQEKGNVEFLVNNEMGIYEPDISKLPRLIEGLLEDKSNYLKYVSNIEKASLTNGAKKVADFIKSF